MTNENEDGDEFDQNAGLQALIAQILDRHRGIPDSVTAKPELPARRYISLAGVTPVDEGWLPAARRKKPRSKRGKE